MELSEAAQAKKVRRSLKTPVAGAVAGMAFAVLFSGSMLVMNSTVTDIANDRGAWLLEGAGRFSFAVGLLPFSGQLVGNPRGICAGQRVDRILLLPRRGVLKTEAPDISKLDARADQGRASWDSAVGHDLRRRSGA